MYVCNCHTPLQTGLKITNRQHTRHSLFFNYQSPCVYTYFVFLTYQLPLQQEIWLAVHSRSNLIGVTYIHLSLTHSLTHSRHDWLKIIVSLFHPIRSKTKSDRKAHVFPRFMLATCNCFEFWLFHCYRLCPLWLARVITLVLVIPRILNWKT